MEELGEVVSTSMEMIRVVADMQLPDGQMVGALGRERSRMLKNMLTRRKDQY